MYIDMCRSMDGWIHKNIFSHICVDMCVQYKYIYAFVCVSIHIYIHIRTWQYIVDVVS